MAVELTVSDAAVAARREWLAASRRQQAHADDCFACLTAWLPCAEGIAHRDATAAAWARYDAQPGAEGVGTGHVTRAQRRYEETGR